MISAVLFDLDGTLVETEELKAISHARSVAELKPDVSEDEVASAYTDELVGHSRQEVAETLVQRFGMEEAARERMEEFGMDEPWQVLVSIRHGFYDEILGDIDLLLEKRYSHNIELLHELRSEGYPTACATMSHRPQVEHVLSVLGLEDELDVVATMDDVERGKPDPEIDLLMAKKLGVPPEEFLVIEDSRAGVGAAVAAGGWWSSQCRPGSRRKECMPRTSWNPAGGRIFRDVVRRRAPANRGSRRKTRGRATTLDHKTTRGKHAAQNLGGQRRCA